MGGTFNSRAHRTVGFDLFCVWHVRYFHMKRLDGSCSEFLIEDGAMLALLNFGPCVFIESARDGMVFQREMEDDVV